MHNVAQAPRTIRSRVLIGWFTRDDSVRFLMNDCHFAPALTANEAEQKWRPFRDRTEALAERDATAPARIALNHDEQQHAQRFINFLRSLGPTDIQDVIKIDLRDLVAHQYHVLVERSQDYRNRVATSHGWLQEALPCQLTGAPLNVRFSQNGLNTALDVDLPHGEFAFLPDQNGQFAPRQLLRHVTVMMNGKRMWLWAGYHRSFARMLAINPAAAVPSAVVALTRNTLVPPNQPAGAAAGLPVDIGPFGRRPALFGDFFNPDLFMEVDLRRKRFQLQMRSTCVPIDDSV
ncbi:MAG: hypothetical protein WA252_11985 [Candidatus Sulfotelmatobacter sp.]